MRLLSQVPQEKVFRAHAHRIEHTADSEAQASKRKYTIFDHKTKIGWINGLL